MSQKKETIAALLLVALLGSGCIPDLPTLHKQAVVDVEAGKVILPDCHDWRHNASHNFDNSTHSNYGCANATNTALMIADPMDMVEGRSDSSPDVQSDVRGITRYHNGEISPPVVSNTTTTTSDNQ